MSRDGELARRLASLLPQGERARYEEQWAADFRDAIEAGLDRQQLIGGAARMVLSIRARHQLQQGWRSPLPWIALYSGGLAGCLIGSADIGLNIGEPETLIAAAFLALVLASSVLTRLAPRLGTRTLLLAGITLSAESLAVSWLGHEGRFELVAGAPLLLWGLVRHVAESPTRRRTRTATAAAWACGAALLLAGLAGAAGQYLDYRLNPGGSDCLESFSGDPSTYPNAPASSGAITTGFSWNPIGRSCTWTSGQPAALNGRTTIATVNHQTDQATSDWIYGTAITGASLLLLAASTSATRNRARSITPA